MPIHKPVTSPKGGRPEVALTDSELQQVEKMAAYLNKAQIAACLGIAENTFLRICKQNESVDAAYKKGKASNVGNVAAALVRNATEKNNVLAQIFYLKSRGGWVESQPEQERPTINISYGQAPDRIERDVTPQPDRLSDGGSND